MTARELSAKIRRAMDAESMALHSMSDPSVPQRDQQRGASRIVRAVNEVLREVDDG